MNRPPPPHPPPPPLDNEKLRYLPPSQARFGPPPSRPTIPFQRLPQPALQRIPSQPQPVLQRRPSRPDQQPWQRTDLHQEPPPRSLQRQPSRPDQNQLVPSQEPPRQSPRPPQQRLQRQPSRPDPYYPQPAPSIPIMSDESYQYKELAVQPVAPAFIHGPSQSPLPSSDSLATLLSPPSRPYADNMLIRGKSDDELDKSDAFWRRFNYAAQPDAERSSWLQKNEGKASRYSRLLWIIGLTLVLIAAAGIGVGIYLSFNDNSNASRPDTIGGAADITSAGGVAATAAAAAPTVGNGDTVTTSILHVSPTNTVA